MSKKLRTLRKRTGMSGSELARKIGVSKVYISQLETGKRTGSAVVLKKIARVLGVPMEEIVTKSTKR